MGEIKDLLERINDEINILNNLVPFLKCMQKYENELSLEAKKILDSVRNGINGEYGKGAQFVTEIQGGSDVPANLVEAVFEKEEYFHLLILIISILK